MPKVSIKDEGGIKILSEIRVLQNVNSRAPRKLLHEFTKAEEKTVKRGDMGSGRRWLQHRQGIKES